MLISGLVLGQVSSPGLAFEVLTVDQGLSQNSGRAMLQDSSGFLWIGTQDGLNKYDGYDFEIFSHDPSDPQSLSDNFVLCLLEDRNGMIWVGTNGGGLNRMDPQTGRFTRFRAGDGDPQSLSSDLVQVLMVDRSGEFWIGTAAGLNRWNPDRADFDHLLMDLGGHGPANVASLCEDRKGRFWVGTLGGGLLLLDRQTGDFQQFVPQAGEANSLPAGTVTAILEDRNGQLWMGTAQGHVVRFDGEEKFELVNPEMGVQVQIENRTINDIFEDSTGQLWISLLGSGLISKEPQSQRWIQYINDPMNPESLSNDFVFSTIEDLSGVLWVGTGGGGLTKIDRRKRKFPLFRREPGSRAGEPSNFVWAIEEDVDRPGAVYWIGTQGAGLQRFERQTGVFTEIGCDPDTLARPSDDTILDICCARHESRGTIWMATQGSGLIGYDEDLGRCSQFISDPDDPQSLSSNFVRSIFEDDQGILWLGTTGGGVNRFDPNTQTVRRYAYDHDDPNTLSNNVVFHIFEDRLGFLWVGTQAGLNRFDRETETFKRFLHDPRDLNSLSNNRVRVIYEMPGASASGGEVPLWVGTDLGLNRLDRQTLEFKVYTIKNGLPNNVIYGILADEAGRLWISTNRGLSTFDPRSETFRNFDHDDGLQSNEFNTGAFCATQAGEMVFGGVNGFNFFDPMKIKDNPFVPPVVLTEFRVFNETIPLLRQRAPGESEGLGSGWKELVLSHTDNVFSFEFAALDFTNPQKNKYAYRLEGFQDAWVECGGRRTATYTNLDPGRYVFQVKGSNSDGVWNPEPTSVAIVVTPPFWRTGPAYLVYILLIFGLLYGFRRFELERERARTRVRESELRAEAAEARARAIASDNARKSIELEEARRLQLSMLPRQLPEVPEMEFAVFMKPATEVGGDYYDFLWVDETLTVAIGDATGHGIKAGMMVAMTKERFCADGAEEDVAGFFAKFNRVFRQMDLDNLYMSLTLVKIRDGQMIATSAGMPPIYIYRAAQKKVEELNLKGMPLGGVDDFFYHEHRTELHRGDCILLLTDGLPELFNPDLEMFDYPTVGKVFSEVADKSPQEIIDHLVDVGETWRRGHPPEDDITFVVLKRRER